MAPTSEPAAVLRKSGAQQVAFIELLFDVVFVFAFTQLAQRLSNDLTWAGLYKALVLLLAVWWIWYRMAWTTNRYNPDRPAIRIMILATMLASLLMSVAVVATFRSYSLGLVFGSTYVLVETLRHLWLVLLGGNRHAQLVSVRVLFWATMSAPLWISGILSGSNHRLAWWTAAVALDYTGGILDFPTPRLGRAGLRGQKVAGEHLVERYRQVLVIALGETILISGIQLAPYAFQRDRTAAMLVSFGTTVALARIYIYRAGALLPEAIAATTVPAYIGELASYAHLTMAAGIILSAVGDKITITHPAGHTPVSWSLVVTGGPAVFLAGRVALEYATFSRVSWSRLVGLVLLAALAPVGTRLPPIGVAAVTAAVLGGVAATDWLGWRRYPRAPLSPTMPSKRPRA